MAVVEYKMHIVGHKGQRQQPMWIREPGHFGHPTNHTMIGWVVDNAEYYVPGTVTTLTKAELVTRQLGIHATNPERIYTGSETDRDAQEADTDNWRDKTDAEVTAEVEAWYDAYVTQCSGIEK
jgi:hypothetical protein